MGSKTTSTTATTPYAGKKETDMLDMLQGVGQQAAGQFGDLSDLASGRAQQLSPEMLQMLDQYVNAQAEQSQNSLQEQFTQQNASLDNKLRSQGQSDSSIEMAKRILGQSFQSNDLRDVELQRQQQYSQYAMQLPFQFGQMQLGANQQLLARLGASTPALQDYMQSRLSRGGQTQKTSGFTLGELGNFMPNSIG